MNEEGQRLTETAVRFERLLPGPIERVWEFLTQRDRLEWIGGGTIEPREGGKVQLADGHIRGVVTQWKPPHRLAMTWNVFMPGEEASPYPESYLRFELEAEGEQVRLTLEHRPMLPRFEAQTLMGWHTMLDLLGAQLRGEKAEPREVIMERNRKRYGVKEVQY